MAAVDYARLRRRLARARPLFVAPREEIQKQSRTTFAHALRDAAFGALCVSGRRPHDFEHDFEHVFASILALTATPERVGGESVLHCSFDDRIAAELRPWDAIDQLRMAPFSYCGIADELVRREIPTSSFVVRFHGSGGGDATWVA